MRSTDTLTISLPPAMLQQMQQVQKAEHRTRSELLREAWRQYFESRYAVYTPTKSELAGIRKGRADFKHGDVVSLSQLHNELESARREKRKQEDRKASRS
jgi:predicted transcriptional regulator